MSEVAEFPLPVDATPEERATATRDIGARTTILADEPRAIRFAGKVVGQTGPIWHFQYVRMYALPKGFLAAGHDLREGIVVVYADAPEDLARGFAHESVRELVVDELTFRGILAKGRGAHAA